MKTVNSMIGEPDPMVPRPSVEFFLMNELITCTYIGNGSYDFSGSQEMISVDCSKLSHRRCPLCILSGGILGDICYKVCGWTA